MRSYSFAFASLLLTLAAVTACGQSSDNNIASRSPERILAAAKSAAAGATSVHIVGSFTSEGAPLVVDQELVRGRGARGQLTRRGGSFQLVAVGGYVYIYGSPAFYRHIGGAAAAQLFQGKWLKAPTDSKEFASLGPLTELGALLNTLLSDAGPLERAGSAMIANQKTVAISELATGETLFIAATGKPYPVAVVKTGSRGGKLILDHWNQPVSLTPPANAIDITALQGMHP